MGTEMLAERQQMIQMLKLQAKVVTESRQVG